MLMCAYVYTRGVGHTDPATSQHNIFDSEKLSQVVLVRAPVLTAPFEPRVVARSRESDTLPELSHPATRLAWQGKG